MNINIKQFYKRFCENYNWLYEYQNSLGYEYQEMVDAFDRFLKNHNSFVCEFVNYRGDFISSDREAAAFMYTLYDMATVNS